MVQNSGLISWQRLYLLVIPEMNLSDASLAWGWYHKGAGDIGRNCEARHITIFCCHCLDIFGSETSWWVWNAWRIFDLFFFSKISLISLKGLSTWVIARLCNGFCIAHSVGWIFCWDCSIKLAGVSMDLQQMRGRGLLHRVYLSGQKDHTGTSQRQGTVVSTKIFRLLRFRKRTFHRWFVIWLGWVWGPFSVCTYASDTGQRVSFFFCLLLR